MWRRTMRFTLDEEVRFSVEDKELNGILTHPTGEGPYPAIVLLHGSNRSGVEAPFYKKHAGNLVQSGFAVLRYDGPGWGGQSSDEVGKRADVILLEANPLENIANTKTIMGVMCRGTWLNRDDIGELLLM